MTDVQSQPEKQTPIHLWIIGVISLLWNLIGAMDYVFTQMRNESYMSAFTPEQLEYFYGFPMWVVASWALATWCSVIGSILLLLRNKYAVWLFLVSFLSMVVTTFHNYILSNGLEVAGDAFSIIFTLIIFVVALGLYFYARAMQNNNVLK